MRSKTGKFHEDRIVLLVPTQRRIGIFAVLVESWNGFWNGDSYECHIDASKPNQLAGVIQLREEKIGGRERPHGN